MPVVGRNEPDRDYLSIREVLDHLVEEFPDVTISKIRFLESRGLIHPERTPSGYRKFFPPDVARLRWILLQQRENFLPLKVIKGRLDQERGIAPVFPAEASLFDSVLNVAELEAREQVPAVAGAPTPLGHPARPAGNGAARAVSAEPRAGRVVASTAEAVAVAAPGAPRHGQVTASSEPPAAPEHVPLDAGEPVASDASVGDSDTETAQPPAPPDTGGDEPPGPDGRGMGRPVRARRDTLTGASLSRTELAGAAGAEPELVDALVEYGLVEGRVVAGVLCFDEDAVFVTKLAAGFALYGIEPRHLRSVKHACERQAALYAQVVLPLLRQRNPSARAKAEQDLEVLADLGRGLQEAFLSVALRELKGS